MPIYLYLKDHALTTQDVALFKDALLTFKVNLEGKEEPVKDGQVRLIAPFNVDSIRLTFSPEELSNVLSLCSRFGFKVTNEAPADPVPAQMDMDLI